MFSWAQNIYTIHLQSFWEQTQTKGWLWQHISVLWIQNPIYRWAKTSRKMTWQSWRLCVIYSPFQYLSKSVCKTLFLLSNFDRQHLLLCPPHQRCPLRIQFVVLAACFCFDVKQKSRVILREIDYTFMLMKILERCVFWQHDNLNHLLI